ncbi:MAG: dihydroneopterin aldolase [Halobacteriales archaeon]|nr:dihydroneopterin aldolase [Halobacteriales archaeon]
MDKILLKGMRFQAHVGATEKERSAPQTLEVDVELWLPLREAGTRDELKATLDYSQAFEAARGAIDAQAWHLLEAIAEEVARRCRELGAQEVVVRVRKLNPPLPGTMEYAEVEMWR